MNLETIERIENQLAEIDDEIRRLELEKDKIIEGDEEYSNYLAAYQSYYDDQPLTIREYYHRMAELEAINQEFKESGPDNIEALMRKHGKRLMQLERCLAA